MTRDLALLDLDGTLVDSLGDLVLAVNRTLADGGLAPLDAEVVRQGIGHGALHLMRHSVARAGGDFETLRWLDRFQHNYLSQLPGAHPLYPRVLEALETLRDRGVELVVVTNKPARPARAILAARGLAPLITAVLGGDTLPERKPSPVPLQRVMQLLGRSPARTVMVGDSGPDVRAARNAGVGAVAVRWGFGDPEDMPTPDRWLEDPGELATIADGWKS